MSTDLIGINRRFIDWKSAGHGRRLQNSSHTPSISGSKERQTRAVNPAFDRNPLTNQRLFHSTNMITESYVNDLRQSFKT
jgi:hypothetical protein